MLLLRDASSYDVFSARSVLHVRDFTGQRQKSMHWSICLIAVFLAGCQAVSPFDRPTEPSLLPIMPLWERYQRCLAATESNELIAIIDHFDRVTVEGVEPPSWMRRWGQHVMNQPLRSSVDPQALGAACTLRAAALFAEGERLTEARALYQRVLARYSDPSLTYYVDQAKERLSSLPDSTVAVVALRVGRPLVR